MSPPVSRFVVGETADVDRLIAGIEQRAPLRREPPRVVERQVLDTFDWRLHRAGTVLERQASPAGVQLVWRSVATGAVLAAIDVGGDAGARFGWELPPAPATARLAALLDVRALVPLASLTSTTTGLRLLDDEGKTVARLTVDQSALTSGERLPVVVEVVAVRGYDREAARLADLLGAQVVLEGGADDVAVAALRAAGHDPGSYSSKLDLDLDPAGTARQAWSEVLRALLATVRANEAGLRADVDSEFLHDLRVAVRRARSVLGEGRAVLAAEPVEHLRAELAWLGQRTGPTRDLDVELLTLPATEGALPPERRADLKPFAAFLEQRQRQAHDELVADLDSPRYLDLLASWRALVDAGPEGAGPRAELGAPAVAAERIGRAHRRLVRAGRAITAASEPERLHDLRKDAKRLRYLLECFGVLFPDEQVRPVVKELKVLQDVLGEYQDCQVQAASLERSGQAMLDEGGAPAATLLAMGLIVQQLEGRERAARAGYAERFARFDRPAVRRAIMGLAGAADAPASPPREGDRR